MVKRYTEAGVVQIGPPGKWIPETDYDALAAQLAIYKGREEAKQLVINQLEAALRKYGDHTIACVLETRGDPCNCGWTKALLSNFARETTGKPTLFSLKFTGKSRDVPCELCGKGFMEHSNFDLACATSDRGVKHE